MSHVVHLSEWSGSDRLPSIPGIVTQRLFYRCSILVKNKSDHLNEKDFKRVRLERTELTCQMSVSSKPHLSISALYIQPSSEYLELKVQNMLRKHVSCSQSLYLLLTQHFYSKTLDGSRWQMFSFLLRLTDVCPDNSRYKAETWILVTQCGMNLMMLQTIDIPIYFLNVVETALELHCLSVASPVADIWAVRLRAALPTAWCHSLERFYPIPQQACIAFIMCCLVIKYVWTCTRLNIVTFIWYSTYEWKANNQCGIPVT